MIAACRLWSMHDLLSYTDQEGCVQVSLSTAMIVQPRLYIHPLTDSL